MHYNKPPETRVVVKFNVESTSSPTRIASAITNFSSIEIDGVVQPNVVTGYTFNTTGEHIVKYTLIDETSIAAGSFKACIKLTSIIIPNSVTSIGNYAFYNCYSQDSITIPDNIITIGDGAFNGCEGLISLTIPNKVTSIGENAFGDCSGLTSVTIPNSVTTIKTNAFSNCRNLTSVHISDLAAWCSIRFLGGISNPLRWAHRLFLNGEEITDLIIPNNVTEISAHAFEYCSSLTSVTIHNGVTLIDGDVFFECDGLERIVCLATTKPSIYNTTFKNIKTNGTLYVPTGSDYSSWMGTGNYYLGKYNWTKVEQ